MLAHDIVQYVAAAKLVDDPDVLPGFLDWLAALLDARHVPTAALIAGLEARRPASLISITRQVNSRIWLKYLALGS